MYEQIGADRMPMNRDWNRDSLTVYEMIDESDSVKEMNDNIRYWIDLFHNVAYDLCSDNGWNEDDIDID